MADVYVVVHFATTFDHSAVYVPRDAGELISLSWCTVDAKSLEALTRHSILVKPLSTPVTPECVQRYNLPWEDVKNGVSFKDAIAEFDGKLMTQLDGKDFSFVTVDVAQLRVLLPREARDKAVVLPAYLQHPRVFDLCNEYLKWQALHPEALSYPGSSLGNIVTALDVDLAVPWSEDSVDHSDVAVDIFAKILVQLLKKSVPLGSHMSVLTKPYDTALDAKVFLAERSKILYLSNLPADTTHSELEAWFTQSGGRPVAFWALKTPDSDCKGGHHSGSSNTKTASGFAIFAKHEEAAEALYMNGRALMEKIVEVQASSTRVLDRASNLLTPFPLLKNRPRPGDWTCPSCGFSNFQRRIACFRCSFPAASALAIQEQIHTGSNNSSYENLGGISNHANGARKQKQDERQMFSGSGGYQDQHQSSMNMAKNNHNNAYNFNHTNSGSRPHYGSQVPFRAGDWKCPNESCQYHNFAKNLCCLKCGASKPTSVMQNNNSGNLNNETHSGSLGTGGSIHSVNTTAAAIAAATASGQPLKLNNNFFALHQPMPHNSRQTGSSHSSSSSLPVHNNGLYSSISQLQQFPYHQGKPQPNSQQFLQHLALMQRRGLSPSQNLNMRPKQAQSGSSSPGVYFQQGHSFKNARDLGDGGGNNGNGMSSLSNQIGSMSLDK